MKYAWEIIKQMQGFSLHRVYAKTSILCSCLGPTCTDVKSTLHLVHLSNVHPGACEAFVACEYTLDVSGDLTANIVYVRNVTHC